MRRGGGEHLGHLTRSPCCRSRRRRAACSFAKGSGISANGAPISDWNQDNPVTRFVRIGEPINTLISNGCFGDNRLSMCCLPNLVKFLFSAAYIPHTWVHVPAGIAIQASSQTCLERLPCLIRRPQRIDIAVVDESHGGDPLPIPYRLLKNLQFLQY